MNVVYVGLGIVILFVAGNVVWGRSLLRKRRELAPPEPPPVMELDSSEPAGPEQIRRELHSFRKVRPALQDQIDAAIAQMDSMDRKQAKLRELFRRNRISSLGEVETTIDDVELCMCRNLVKLINRMVLWDPLEWNKPGKEPIYAEHRAYIQKMLAKNDAILSKCDILLVETVSYMDEKDSDMDSGQLHLDVMTETIQSLRQISRTES